MRKVFVPALSSQIFNLQPLLKLNQVFTMGFAPLSFLRPLPAPHPSFVRTLLRQVSTTPQRSFPIRTPESSEPASSTRPPPPSPENPLKPLSYHVNRTPSKLLPVYHTTKRGGNLHQTRIRKIDGNLEDLRADLQKALDLDKAHISINQLTKHIIIKGWKRRQVAAFLEQQRF